MIASRLASLGFGRSAAFLTSSEAYCNFSNLQLNTWANDRSGSKAPILANKAAL